MAELNRTYISGGSQIEGNLEVNGNAVINGDLTADNLNATGTINGASIEVTGDVKGNNIKATNSIETTSLTATGAVQGASLSISGASSLNTLSSSGKSTLNSLEVTTNETVKGNLTVNGSISCADLFLKIYPIGSIYMSVNDVSPEEFLGGTWERWGQGRVPVGVDESDEDFEKPNLINGEKKHTLTKDEMAKHSHGFLGGSHTFLWGQGNATVYARNAVAVAGTPPSNELCTIQNTWTKTDDNATNVNAHNNLQPYITCYMWKRTA